MDSLSQAALGAAVSIAVMGRRVSVRRSAAWGAVAGTLPDLDVFIDHGDPILNMVLHRGPSHALLYLAAFALPFGAAVAAVHRETALRWRWIVAMALALVTHPLLDAMTVYGTRLGLPFTDHPYAVGSVFIIDPLYTLPLLIGVLVALWRDRAGGPERARRGRVPSWMRERAGSDRAAPRAAVLGLVLSTAYLGWTAAAQRHVAGIATASLKAAGLPAAQVLVTPTPFNTLLWRVVALDGERFHEGYRSLLDRAPAMTFEAHERSAAVALTLPPNEPAALLREFSRGYWKLELREGLALISDLRMGQEPTYVFSFAIAEDRGSAWHRVQPALSLGGRPDLASAWHWLWRRALGQPLPPPR